MTRRNCLSIGIALLALATSGSSQAQTYWGTTATPTYTSGQVGIGYSSYISDAKLDIYNNASFSGSGPSPIPEVKINRYFMPTIPGTPPNVFEYWYQPGIPTGSPSTLIDVINPNGYLGILKSNPTAPLDVAGNALIEQNEAVVGNIGIGGTVPPINARLYIENVTTGGSTNIPEIKINRNGILTEPVNFVEVGNGGSTVLDVINYSGYLGILQTNPSQALDVNGNAYIENAAIIGKSYTTGSAVPLTTPGLSSHEYSLYVANGILTEKVKVSLSNTANWSDFVFNKNYELMPLQRLEEYVNINNHLPEIPSATQVVNDGIDLAGMDAKLLQKIEELTLYVIQQQKQIDTQEKEIEKLKK